MTKLIARAKDAKLLRMVHIANCSASNGTTIGTNSTVKCFNDPAAASYAATGCRPYLSVTVSACEVRSCHLGRAPPDKLAGLRAAKPLVEDCLSTVDLDKWTSQPPSARNGV